MDNIKTLSPKRGVNLSFMKSDRFKTNLISVYLRLPLCEETATMAALLPRVLKQGCREYPSMAEISKQSEELYGTSISAGVLKKGDFQLIRFSAESVADRFISESITRDVLSLMSGIILDPKTDGNAFDAEYVSREKENLKSLIEGLINDKKDYAAVRANEIMFEGDPYGVFEYGKVSRLSEIDEKSLYTFYLETLRTAQLDIFVSGSFDEDMIKAEIERAFAPLIFDREPITEKTRLAAVEKDIEVKRVTEEMQVVQSKLVMGFNCDVRPTERSFYALALFSCIFGGSPFSKLFNNVREKLSLAYYVSSGIDRQKCYMKISAGIEASKYSAAYDEIFVQLDKMKNGDFTDDEIESAKKYLTTAIGSMKDSMAAEEGFVLGHMMLGLEETPQSYLDNICSVCRDEIIAAANSVQLDTVYFLKGGEGK